MVTHELEFRFGVCCIVNHADQGEVALELRNMARVMEATREMKYNKIRSCVVQP